jgi:hypothetical protein
MKRALLPLISVLVAGCASGGEVYLRSPMGQTVQCGPFTSYGTVFEPSRELQEQRLRDCIADYQRQGYERVAAP